MGMSHSLQGHHSKRVLFFQRLLEAPNIPSPLSSLVYVDLASAAEETVHQCRVDIPVTPLWASAVFTAGLEIFSLNSLSSSKMSSIKHSF